MTVATAPVEPTTVEPIATVNGTDKPAPHPFPKLLALMSGLLRETYNTANRAESEDVRNLRTALASLDAAPDLPGIVAARAALSADIDKASEHTQDATYAAIRASMQPQFDELSRLGLPRVTVPTAKSNRTARAAANAESAIQVSTDGVRYVKRLVPRAAFPTNMTGDPCGECRYSEIAASQPSAAVSGYRMNLTKAISEMSSAELTQHAPCALAANIAELTFTQVVTATTYVRESPLSE